MQDIPEDLVQRIKTAFLQGNYFLSLHSDDRRIERLISPIGLRLVVLNGTAIEFDPAPTIDKGDSVLFNGTDEHAVFWHVKVAEVIEAKRKYLVITVYKPDPNVWEIGFKQRRLS